MMIYCLTTAAKTEAREWPRNKILSIKKYFIRAANEQIEIGSAENTAKHQLFFSHRKSQTTNQFLSFIHVYHHAVFIADCILLFSVVFAQNTLNLISYLYSNTIESNQQIK